MIKAILHRWKRRKHTESKENFSNTNRHYENLEYVLPQPTHNLPPQQHPMHITTV